MSFFRQLWPTRPLNWMCYYYFQGTLRSVCEQSTFTPRAERQKLPTFQYNSSITVQQIFQNIWGLLNWWSELPDYAILPPTKNRLCMWWSSRDSCQTQDCKLKICIVRSSDSKPKSPPDNVSRQHSKTQTSATDRALTFTLLYVVIWKCTSIFQLLASKDKSLLVRRYPFFVLDLSFYILNGIRWFHFQGNCLSCQCLYKDLHTTTQTENQMQSGF